MKEYALVQGAIVGTLSAVGVLGGAALGCAIGFLFGPIGCVVGAIVGALLGWAAGTGAGFYVASAIAFNANPGDVEDANVGDKSLGPIRDGDKVVVYGEHVYDGFHEGWHEFHPLIAVIKLDDSKMGQETPLYLEWDPNWRSASILPKDLPDMPSTPPSEDITKLEVKDMKEGLNSEKFRRRAKWLHTRWCDMLSDTCSEKTRQAQQALSERWTIHPLVDGCNSQQDLGENKPPVIK